MDRQELVNRFTYHAPQGDQPARYTQLRGYGLVMASLIEYLVPESRERDMAIERVEEAIMWGNAGIARRSGGD